MTSTAPHTLRYVVYHHHGDGNCTPTILPYDDGFQLTSDGHPICHLEEGSHEWWPWASDEDDDHDCFGSDCHDGTGANYLTQNVLNLGEAFAPMPGDEPQMILFFNGTWGHYGDSPLGPVSQFYPIPPRLSRVYVDRGTGYSEPGLGSRYRPANSLQTAAAKLLTDGVISVRPGCYSEPITISTPMTIEAW